MTVTISKLIVGPAWMWRKLYTDPAAEPLTPLITPAAGWVDCGGTQDGINLTIAQSFEQITADQIVDILMSVPNERTFNVETNLLEPTLENMKFANNGGQLTTGTGWQAFEPIVDLVNEDVLYSSVIIRGRGANTGRMRDIIVRRVLNTDDVEFAYQKAGAQVLATTLTAHYVSGSIAPFRIVDAV